MNDFILCHCRTEGCTLECIHVSEHSLLVEGLHVSTLLDITGSSTSRGGMLLCGFSGFDTFAYGLQAPEHLLAVDMIPCK